VSAFVICLYLARALAHLLRSVVEGTALQAPVQNDAIDPQETSAAQRLDFAPDVFHAAGHWDRPGELAADPVQRESR
jgi:hypothetical protein